MVKKLKTKFIIINMSIVGAIIIAIFTFICIFTYNSQLKQTIFQLESAGMMTDKKPNKPSNKDKAPLSPDRYKDELFEIPNIFIYEVAVDGNGKILNANTKGEEIDSTSLQKAVDIVLDEKKDSGRVKGASLIFLKKSSPFGTVILFTSSKPIDASIKNTVIISLILSVISILLFFILSERLAHLAIKPVEKAWESQRQLVQDASHDLKTPLTVILANNDIVLSHRESTVKEQERWLCVINEEALKMKVLVEQMLELAKSENPKSSIIFKEINASEISLGTALQLEPVAFEKNVSFDIHILPSIMLYTSKAAFIKILETLIENAIKYSPSSSTVTISLQKEQQRTVLSVTNNGYIEKHDIEHIFERFYRADPSRSEGGYGLGLAIAKNLSNAIGAELSVKSSLENGTTFYLAFRK